MEPEESLDLSSFILELQRESERGLALVAAALVDEKLLSALQSFVCPGKSADRLLARPESPLGTFSARTDACLALGLIDDFEFSEITLLRKVRNEFAHAKHGMSFQNEKVRGLCSSFQSDIPVDSNYPTDDARFRFTNATVCLVLRLWYRGAFVEREKRTAKVWVTVDQAKWRSVDDDPPPLGEHVITIGHGRIAVAARKP